MQTKSSDPRCASLTADVAIDLAVVDVHHPTDVARALRTIADRISPANSAAASAQGGGDYATSPRDLAECVLFDAGDRVLAAADRIAASAPLPADPTQADLDRAMDAGRVESYLRATGEMLRQAAEMQYRPDHPHVIPS